MLSESEWGFFRLNPGLARKNWVWAPVESSRYELIHTSFLILTEGPFRISDHRSGGASTMYLLYCWRNQTGYISYELSKSLLHVMQNQCTLVLVFGEDFDWKGKKKKLQNCAAEVIILLVLFRVDYNAIKCKEL
jgi:hypothetical protein